MALDHQKLGIEFFDRDVHKTARALLGTELVRSYEGQERRGRIVEVEVYEGVNDRASHARSGKPTARTAPMFADPATIYIYTIYGIYQCLNLRAPSTAGPGAILIRACVPLDGQAVMAVDRGIIDHVEEYDQSMAKKLMSGPGKICQALRIDPEMSGSSLGNQLRIEAGVSGNEDEQFEVKLTPRVGLNPKTCGEAADWLWRYIVADSPWTSCRAG